MEQYFKGGKKNVSMCCSCDICAGISNKLKG